MNRNLIGTVALPGSKSESNRALMIAAYGGFPLEVKGLSEAHDTVLLQTLLQKINATVPSTNPVVVDCEDAGTVARFLMTYLAMKPGAWLLTGTPRLRQRPMAPLVEALRRLGAEIQYMETDGQLPMRIQGRAHQGGEVSIDASQSSQFVTSLLMAAPCWNKGLRLNLCGKRSSWPYVQMTMVMMRAFGVEVGVQGHVLTVEPLSYRQVPFEVGADWSAASYWYEMAALCDHCDLLLQGLRWDSAQGDVRVAEIYRAFGVQTTVEKNGVRLTKSEFTVTEPMVLDFTDNPDLFPAVFVTCVALGVPVVFHGMANLTQKESNRVESLVTELSKYYTFINIIEHDEVRIEKSSLKEKSIHHNQVFFNTYSDHRIAMALSGLVFKLGNATFDHPEVVVKSYPSYWSDIQTILCECFF